MPERKRQPGLMFTSVEVDKDLYARALYYAPPNVTKKSLINEALRTYVMLHDQTEAKKLRGRLVWSGGFEDLRE